MAPFRNKGWKYFKKINEIIPNANARGSYAFSPMNASATTGTDPEQLGDELEDPAQALTETTGTTANMSNHHFDRDASGDGTTLISKAASKLLKIPSTFDNLNDNTGISEPISSNPTSGPTLPSSISTTGFVRSPKGSSSRKTRSTPIDSKSVLRPQASAGPSRRQRAAPAVSSRRSSNNNTQDEAASSSILVHNMQGSINMLTATVRDSVAVDPITKVRQEAVRLLQKEEGLSTRQQIILFQKFTDKHALAQTYLAIESVELRMGWLQELLKDVDV